jgi:hypothetical protein
MEESDGYQIEIQRRNGDFFNIREYCDGSDLSVYNSRQCNLKHSSMNFE